MEYRKLASLLVLFQLFAATGLPVAQLKAQQPYYVVSFTTCEAVQETEPWDPINTTKVFSTIDKQVVLWVRFGNVVSELYLRYEFLKPDGSPFGVAEDIVPDPAVYDVDYYETYTHSMTMELKPIEGLGDPRDYTGEWKVNLYVNNEYVLTFNFLLLKFGITDYTMCENIQNASPWNPINRKDVFGADDLYATAWVELSNLTKGVNVEFKWIDPDGATVLVDRVWVPDPRTRQAEYYSTFRVGQQFTLAETSYYQDPKEKPGLWKVEVYVDGTNMLSMTFTVEEPPGCLIATAAYGSELAPEVQALREFRDGIVMNTNAGSHFMRAFNAFYYSFSPEIAKLELKYKTLRSIIRTIVRPLLIILDVSSNVFEVLSFSPEIGIVLSGIAASSMIGALYLTPILALIALVLKNKLSSKRAYSFFGLWLISGLLLLGVGEISQGSLLLIGSSLIVLSAMSLSALLALNLASKLIALFRKTSARTPLETPSPFSQL